MSRQDNGNSLEKQLADLHIKHEVQTATKLKKTPPAVPPKNKAHPQIPHSVTVNTLREPSYSSRIFPVSTNNNHQTYTPKPNQQKNYVDRKTNNLTDYRNPIPKYSNLPTYRNRSDELPPPPPPPPPHQHQHQHNYDQISGVDEFLPAPPSPVSSNYSELVRAASSLNYARDRSNFPPIYQNEYPAYAGSQASTYESLYEPIIPRPHSSNSSRAMTSLQSNYSQQPSKSPLPKEEEVDALTNLLVKSISDGQEPDVFGVCVKCTEKIVGESSGCTAMGNMYHVECFCCQYCNINLQGKAFYAVDGHPYCEIDYLETLEKCSVCDAPILDRILRATGKPYHPSCFTCVVCGKSLDGIPFTVDALNQIHCIEDFHKKFAPKCCVCELPIMPEEGEEETVRIVALDRSFHVRCYRCEDCGLLLTSEGEGRGCYPLDNHILCKTCNGHRIRLLTNVMTTDL